MHHISALNTAYALSTTQWQKPTATNQSAKFTLGSPDAAAQDELSSAAGGSAPQSIVNALQPVAANAAEADAMQADPGQTGKGAFVDVMA
jgi:hypothetical protein